MDLIWMLMYAPAALSVLGIAVWVWSDRVEERRREADRPAARPVIVEGRLAPEVGQMVAVGVAPVPPRSHRRRTSASYRSDAAVAFHRYAASRG